MIVVLEGAATDDPVAQEHTMKFLMTIAAAGLLLGSASLAIAQNAPSTQVAPSPASINKGTRPTVPSGSESQTAAGAKRQHVAGHGKFCKQASPNSLHCYYASLSSCQKHSKSDALHCVSNPNRS